MQLEKRFEPWPTWIQLCEIAFNFKNDIEQEERKLHFSQLLEFPHGINPLSTKEKERLVEEYVTLLFQCGDRLKSISIRIRITIIMIYGYMVSTSNG